MTRDPHDFQREYGAWAAATWPHQSPSSILAHLREEVDELALEAAADEAADCLLLLLNLAHLRGFSLWDAAVRKARVNYARRWGPPDAQGVSHHEEGAG